MFDHLYTNTISALSFSAVTLNWVLQGLHGVDEKKFFEHILSEITPGQKVYLNSKIFFLKKYMK